MRCPECKEGEMKLSLFIRRQFNTGKDKGKLKCDKCEHEVSYL